MLIFKDQEQRFLLNGPAGLLAVKTQAGQRAASVAESVRDTVKGNVESAVAIICHPHPLHGGSMDNKVVTTLARAYRQKGINVVRFNFRGVGDSEGVYDDAQGEQQDLLAVLAWCHDQMGSQYSDVVTSLDVSEASVKSSGKLATQLWLAGFSFGSAIAAQASFAGGIFENWLLQHLLLVAPPVERYAFDRNREFNCPVTVIQGGSDERVNALGVKAWHQGLKSASEWRRLPDAGHFFHGLLPTLKNEVLAAIEWGLSEAV